MQKFIFALLHFYHHVTHTSISHLWYINLLRAAFPMKVNSQTASNNIGVMLYIVGEPDMIWNYQNGASTNIAVIQENVDGNHKFCCSFR